MSTGVCWPRAQLLQQGEAIGLRQHHVQDQQVEGLAQAARGVAAVAFPFDGVADAGQVGNDGLGDVGSVFDQQDAHGISSVVFRCRCWTLLGQGLIVCQTAQRKQTSGLVRLVTAWRPSIRSSINNSYKSFGTSMSDPAQAAAILDPSRPLLEIDRVTLQYKTTDSLVRRPRTSVSTSILATATSCSALRAAASPPC
jgi:hypothetical protein